MGTAPGNPVGHAHGQAAVPWLQKHCVSSCSKHAGCLPAPPATHPLMPRRIWSPTSVSATSARPSSLQVQAGKWFSCAQWRVRPHRLPLQGSMRGERHRSSLEHQVRLGPVLDQVPARHRGWQQTIRHELQPAFSRTAAAAAFIQSARLHKALTAGCAHLTCERNWGSEKPPPGAHRRLSVPLATLGWLPFARPDCSRQQHAGC